jgi:DNA-directed RNA polymerase specialized sigma24 family protein
MFMKSKKQPKTNAARPRLSDEELDPLEDDDIESHNNEPDNEWVPWSSDDLIDIKRVMDQRMPEAQKIVLECFLHGITHKEIGVTEKYFRYHYKRAIKFIQKELGLNGNIHN